MFKSCNSSVYVLMSLGLLLISAGAFTDSDCDYPEIVSSSLTRRRIPRDLSTCPLPPPVRNGHWEIYSSLCANKKHCNISLEPEQLTMNADTKLVYFCDNGYRLLGNGHVNCTDGGIWSPVPRCAACGTSFPEDIRTSSVSGSSIHLMNPPWHTSIYRINSTNSKTIFICGATIITDELLITGAHCMFNEETRELENPSEFFIKAANERALRLHVKKIYKNCNYRGVADEHDNDVAILEIEPRLMFTPNLFPICFEENAKSPEPGEYGLIAGFENPKGKSSRPILKKSLVPFLPKNDCIRQSAIFSAQAFVTGDKFCTGYANGSAVCSGDSGSGLAFKKDNLWYLRGILSVIIRIDSTENARTCDNHKSTLYTDVSHHISWIQDIILRVEKGKTIPECPPVIPFRETPLGYTGAEHASPFPNQCSAYLFRCNDGACVGRRAICDGKTDCVDGSDETLPSCGGCNATEFKCSTGQCIDKYKVCDGSLDCPDKSDETAGICIGYEDLETTTKSSEKRHRTKPTPQRGCSRPPEVRNGYWKLHSSQCPSSSDHCEPREGVHMVPGTHLVYICNNGYHLTNVQDVYCATDGSWSVIPQCEEIHCKVLDTPSTKADCSRNGQWTSCAIPVLPGTQAHLSCRSAYRREDSVWQRNHVTCNTQGLWEPEAIQCIPVCGTKPSKSVKPLIVDGFQPNITDFPWHATLYETNSEKVKKFICGATVITENLLITAAHCIFDEGTKKSKKPEKFLISVGNIFRDYDMEYPPQIEVRKAKVINIYMNCDYQGYRGNHDQDIAILRVEPSLDFKSYLVPICLDTTVRSLAIDIGTLGQVAGFGRTATGSSSSIIRALSVPVVPKNKCIEQADEVNGRNFITPDKFCAGYTNGSSVCNGDSGGGLIFETNRLSYLRGIVSSGIGVDDTDAEATCDNNRYTIYTEVAFHISWIQDIMFKVKHGQSIPGCLTSRRR
ncbi:modular serine protease [Diachasma alloeum]|uniref:modular serine protease n=1 Tax=Diachasma alloeum TaxID=454923 RepID=UPI00073828B6|nr:modular serine protease [Diachasma alloeum]